MSEIDLRGLHSDNPDTVWDIASSLADLFIQQHIETQERRKERRRAKARARYAIRKASGALARKAAEKVAAKQAEIELERRREEQVAEGCYCVVCRMPPCSWCENGGGTDDDN